MPLKRSALWFDPRVKPEYGQAEIDWTHPLAAGLHRLVLFDLGGQATRDLVTRESFSHTRVNADTGSFAGQRGLQFASGATGTGTGDGFVMTRTSELGADSVSMAAGLRLNATNGLLESMFGTGGTGGTVFCCREAATDISPTFAYYTLGGGGNPGVLFVADSNGLGVGAQGASTLSTGVEYDVAGTFARNTGIATYGGTWTAYLNGVADGSNNFSLAGSFGGTFSNTTVRLCNSIQFANSSHMFMTYFTIWRRALSAGEIAWVKAEPYAMLAPVVRRRYFVPTAIDPATSVPPIEQQAAFAPVGVWWR